MFDDAEEMITELRSDVDTITNDVDDMWEAIRILEARIETLKLRLNKQGENNEPA